MSKKLILRSYQEILKNVFHTEGFPTHSSDEQVGNIKTVSAIYLEKIFYFRVTWNHKFLKNMGIYMLD